MEKTPTYDSLILYNLQLPVGRHVGLYVGSMYVMYACIYYKFVYRLMNVLSHPYQNYHLSVKFLEILYLKFQTKHNKLRTHLFFSVTHENVVGTKRINKQDLTKYIYFLHSDEIVYL